MVDSMRRELGLIGATALGLGSVLGTGVFVSIGLAAGISGYWVVLAIIVAAFLATCNGLNSAQLAANHAVSGGAYEYGHVYLFPWAGFLAGWVFVAAKTASSAAAAMGFAGYLVKAFGMDPRYSTAVALAGVALLTLFVSLGIRRSNQLNTVVVSVTILALVAFCVVGVNTLLGDESATVSEAATPFDFTALLNASAVMFVAFTGYGRVATLGEEVREPRRVIPRAIVGTLAVSAVLYIAVALVATSLAGPVRYASLVNETAAPLEMIAMEVQPGWLPVLMAVGAITAMLGVLLNLLLGVSRVVLSMGRRGDLPRVFSKLDTSTGSPVPAVLLTAVITALLVLLDDLSLTWSFSAFTVLLYYAINNLAALKIPKDKKLFPAWIAIAGLVICLSLAWWVEWQAVVAGLVLVGVGVVWRFIFRAINNGGVTG